MGQKSDRSTYDCPFHNINIVGDYHTQGLSLRLHSLIEDKSVVCSIDKPSATNNV